MERYAPGPGAAYFRKRLAASPACARPQKRAEVDLLFRAGWTFFFPLPYSDRDRRPAHVLLPAVSRPGLSRYERSGICGEHGEFSPGDAPLVGARDGLDRDPSYDPGLFDRIL